MKNYLSLFDKRTILLNIGLLLIVAVCFAIDSVLGGAATGSLAMAGGGSKFRNSQPVDGAGWDRKFNISPSYAELLENVSWEEADDKQKVKGWYNSSTAFTSNASEYDGFPIGSKIEDIQAGVIYMHQTATTWIANAYA